MSEFIGVVCGATTGRVFAVINPDEDHELDNPRWLLLKIGAEDREPLALIRVPRGDYEAALSMEDVEKLVARTQAS